MSEISIPCTGVSFQSISAKARPFPSALLGVERHEQKEVAWYRLLVLISSAVFSVQPDDQINCQSETTMSRLLILVSECAGDGLLTRAREAGLGLRWAPRQTKGLPHFASRSRRWLELLRD